MAKSKKKRKPTTKRQNTKNRARAGVKGMIIEYQDVDPLAGSPTIKGTVTHRNPVLNLCAAKVYHDFHDWIRNREPFLWRVTMKVETQCPNGYNYFEEREVTAFTLLNRLNEYCMDAIEDAFRHVNMDYYVTTHFKMECIDTADRRGSKKAA